MSDLDYDQSYGAPVLLEDGPFRGWLTWGNGRDPFETLCGPLCFRIEEDGRARAGFMPERRHLNGGGFLHGGALMTFADFALFAFAHETLKGQHAVTVTLSCELAGAGIAGEAIYAEGRVVRETRSLVFLQGLLEQGGAPIMSFSGVLKKISRR